MHPFLLRVIGALRLDAQVYEEVEADAGATGRAVIVVLLAGLAAGLGATGLHGDEVSAVLVAQAGFMALLAWAAWALMTSQIGGQLLAEPQTRMNVGQLLRATGFSAAPGLFLWVGALGFATAIFTVTTGWLLATMVVAIRQALDFTSTPRAIAVCALGWMLTLVFIIGFGWLFGPGLVA